MVIILKLWRRIELNKYEIVDLCTDNAIKTKWILYLLKEKTFSFLYFYIVCLCDGTLQQRRVFIFKSVYLKYPSTTTTYIHIFVHFELPSTMDKIPFSYTWNDIYLYFFYPPPCSTSLSNNITVQHTDSNTFLQLNSIRISCSYFVGGLCEAVCGCFCFSFTSFDSGWLGMLCVCVLNAPSCRLFVRCFCFFLRRDACSKQELHGDASPAPSTRACDQWVRPTHGTINLMVIYHFILYYINLLW